jgi:hypothetical protein
MEGTRLAVATSLNNQSLLEPATRSRPFGTSALRSRHLLAQASRPPADVRDLERYVQAQEQADEVATEGRNHGGRNVKEGPSAVVKDGTALVGGVIWGPIGVLLMGIGAGLANPVFRIALIVIGVALVVRFLPPAFRVRLRELRENDPLNAYLEPPKRLKCPCCGNPTLRPGLKSQSCVLCEWDDLDSEEAGGLRDEELRSCRTTFQQYGSIYPPDKRPAWAPMPPTADELELRRFLVELYAKAATARGEELLSAWEDVEARERDLRQLCYRRAEVPQSRQQLGEREDRRPE